MSIKPILLYTIALIISLVFIPSVFSEYNLATGEEETLFISKQKEINMGKSISKQVEKKFHADENYSNQEKIDLIGQKIVEVSDRKGLIYHFMVLDEEDVENAFALPGGYIYIFKALFEKLEDDEIAAILAHEIGHVAARHSIKRLQSGLGYQILQVLVIAGAKDSYTRGKASLALGHLMLANSREHELEADQLAVKYLEKAGYDPEAMLRVINKLIKWQMKHKTTPKRYWYTHPYLSARRSGINREIKGEMSFDDYVNVPDEEGYIIPY